MPVTDLSWMTMTAFAIVGWSMLGGFLTGVFVKFPDWWQTDGSPEPPDWWLVECD